MRRCTLHFGSTGNPMSIELESMRIDIVSPSPFVIAEAEEDEFVDGMNSNFGTLDVAESESESMSMDDLSVHHRPHPPSSSMSVSMPTPGGTDDAYWICNECTFRNNARTNSNK